MATKTRDPVPPHLQSRLSSLRARARSQAHRVVLGGLGVSAVLAGLIFWFLDSRRERLDRMALTDVAVPAATHLLQRLRSNLEVLRGTGAFVVATDEALTAERFHRFTEPLLARHPMVYAIEWAPRVGHERRSAFEAGLRAEGVAGFVISEPSAAGALRPAAPRDAYFPILFEEPHGGAVGLDVGFEPSRRRLLRQAFESGDVVVSAPFELAERDAREKHVAAYLSVDSPPGLVILVLRTESLFEDWVEQIPSPDVRVWVEGRQTVDGQMTFGQRPKSNSTLTWEESVPFGRGEIRLGFSVPWGFGGGGSLVWFGTVATLVIGLMGTAAAWSLERVKSLRAQVEKAKELGQYIVEKRLGQGAMGVVFLARHALMKRPTALKLMLSQDPKSIERFEREVRLSCQLSHPNIVALYDFGRTEDGIFYYAMEYLRGVDLHTLVLERGAVADGRAVRFLLQLARGLREAHSAGLIHRDIKPGNLVITRMGTQADVLKILDFGLVKPVESTEGDGGADAGRIVGTPSYMAPEAISDPDSVGPAADTYALGCVAFHLLSGRPPFMGATVRAILNDHLERDPPTLRGASTRSVTLELDELIAQCLNKDPDERPTDDDLVYRLENMPVVVEWTEWDAAEWWSHHESPPPAPETTSINEVTVLAQRAAVD